MTHVANPWKTQQSNMEAVSVNRFKDRTCSLVREASSGGIIAWDQRERIKTKGPLKERNRSDRALRTKVPSEHGKQKLGDTTQQ
jgi:hypothetical protein